MNALAIVERLPCDCYHPDELEYDPTRKCAKCQLLDIFGSAA